MSEPNREAAEAAVDAAEAMISRYRNGPSASCDIARAALGAAAPHLLAAKNAELTAARALLKETMGYVTLYADSISGGVLFKRATDLRARIEAMLEQKP